MRTLVVDASALGALVFGEPHAERISHALSEATLVAPALLWYEMSAVAAKKIRQHPELAAPLLDAFRLAFHLPITLDALVKSRRSGRHSKKLQMQGARILRNEEYIEVRRSDER